MTNAQHPPLSGSHPIISLCRVMALLTVISRTDAGAIYVVRPGLGGAGKTMRLGRARRGPHPCALHAATNIAPTKPPDAGAVVQFGNGFNQQRDPHLASTKEQDVHTY